MGISNAIVGQSALQVIEEWQHPGIDDWPISAAHLPPPPGAMQHTPGSARTLVRLGKMLDRMGRHQEAITLFGVCTRGVAGGRVWGVPCCTPALHSIQGMPATRSRRTRHPRSVHVRPSAPHPFLSSIGAARTSELPS
jgi:hypothetical protein